jgi:AcrR family transcriptional regulator
MSSVSIHLHSPSLKRRRARYPRNGERTRRRLIRAAIRLFSARGYDGVSVDQVAGAAHVDKALVYHYFKGKEDLYRAALREVYQRPDGAEQGALRLGASAPEKLAHLLRAMAGFLEENPEYVRLLLWENLGQGRRLQKRERILGKSFLPEFNRIIEDGIASGELRPKLDPAHLFIAFIGLCFTYHSNRHFLEQEIGAPLGDSAARAVGLSHAVQLVLHGIVRR